MKASFKQAIVFLLPFLLIYFTFTINAQQPSSANNLDEKVKLFLEEYEDEWSDMNIPVRDGEFMYNLIIENNYTRALEIGTSTGHSAIWIAWALSKTGGKLITIEIDVGRYEEALENFKNAGVSEFIDARLADAHLLVKELEGSFDFVFSDADKNWYKKYFIDVAPKMSVGGCFTAHNIRSHSGRSGIKEFVDYIKTLPNFDTTIESDKTSGMSISYKTTAD